MEASFSIDRLGKEYRDHSVFNEISQIEDFYKSLSFSIMGFVKSGVAALINMDTYVYSSIQGTIESIRVLLENGRINDAYALLRKYQDSTIINIYSTLFLEENISIENFIVQQIDGWVKGEVTIPEYRIMSGYIQKSDRVKPVRDLLLSDNIYKEIRERCNAHTHYNFYKYVLLNDNEIHLPQRVSQLSQFEFDIRSLFIQHFAYLFFINQHYMASTDYVDYLDCGSTPPEDSQYWVSSFIQEMFDRIVKPHRPDIAKLIIENTSMHLE